MDKSKLRKALFKMLVFAPFKGVIKSVYGGYGSILFLHRVVDNDDKRERLSGMKANEVTLKYIEEMITYFKENDYEIISIEELYLRISNNKLNKKRKAIVFTFDDGYKDNYTLAYPVFKKHNVPFTIYIACSFPDKTAKIWWYFLEDIIINAKSNIIKIQINSNNHIFDLNVNSKDSVFKNIRTLILKSTPDEQDNIFQQLDKYSQYSLGSYVDNMAMSWSEIRIISQDSLVTIGAHTLNHHPLNSLSKSELTTEILDSKTLIESKINHKVHHFAYPYGTVAEAGEREFSFLKKSGQFHTAVTTRCSNIFPAHNAYLEMIPRQPIRGDQESIGYLQVYLSGLWPALINKFNKVITN